jgi:hypothetical protein
MEGGPGAFRVPPKEAPPDETCIDFPIPSDYKAVTKRIRLIKRGHGRHHVNNGLRAESSDSSAPIVLKLICNMAQERP